MRWQKPQEGREDFPSQPWGVRRSQKKLLESPHQPPPGRVGRNLSQESEKQSIRECGSNMASLLAPSTTFVSISLGPSPHLSEWVFCSTEQEGK